MKILVNSASKSASITRGKQLTCPDDDWDELLSQYTDLDGFDVTHEAMEQNDIDAESGERGIEDVYLSKDGTNLIVDCYIYDDDEDEEYEATAIIPVTK